MIMYLDTSALIKKYVREEGSDEVLRFWNTSTMTAVSSVAYAEFFAALNRKRREKTLSEKEYESAARDLKDDWKLIVKIEVTEHLNQLIENVTSQYPLRGFDAIHLGSALYLQEFEEEQLYFLYTDHRLNDAARSEHLHVIDLART